MFGTFAESSTNVSEFIETAVEYGVEHLERTVAATTVRGCSTHVAAKEVSDSARNGGTKGVCKLGHG